MIFVGAFTSCAITHSSGRAKGCLDCCMAQSMRVYSKEQRSCVSASSQELLTGSRHTLHNVCFVRLPVLQYVIHTRTSLTFRNLLSLGPVDLLCLQII